MLSGGIVPKAILTALRQEDLEQHAISKTIYNEQAHLRKIELANRSSILVLESTNIPTVIPSLDPLLEEVNPTYQLLAPHQQEAMCTQLIQISTTSLAIENPFNQ
ncbi:hypothetical protein G9A89_007168 [Geosiphon pyriformis]|nr:hypothetical protein G9A89_007168 [Geosiphon pyriformis]